jgi:hypothetical protein
VAVKGHRVQVERSREQGEGSTDGGSRWAYLLLSHKNPRQVEDLTGRILDLSPTACVVIHHDLRGGAMPWDGQPPTRVHFVERIPVEWGGWSIVEATMRMICFAQEQLDIDWMVIVSGEHWPVTDLADWEARVATSASDALMPAELLPTRPHFGRRNADANRDLARCILRWRAVRRPRRAALHRALAALSKVSNLTHPVFKLEFSQRNDAWFVGVARRRGPLKGWDLYKGPEWFACNSRSARVLMQADKEVTTWFKRSHIPDESSFQSLLRHDNQLTVSCALVTWVPPQPPSPTSGWMLLKPNELDQAVSSGAAFARKLDPERNPDVRAAIDELVDAGRRATEVRSR